MGQNNLRLRTQVTAIDVFHCFAVFVRSGVWYGRNLFKFTRRFRLIDVALNSEENKKIFVARKILLTVRITLVTKWV